MRTMSIRRTLVAGITAIFFVLGAGGAYARDEQTGTAAPETSNAGAAARTHATAAKKPHTAKVKHIKKSKASKAKKSKKAKKHSHRHPRPQ
jgi:hypothetical protein